jgi:hypothetical protein
MAHFVEMLFGDVFSLVLGRIGSSQVLGWIRLYLGRPFLGTALFAKDFPQLRVLR